ncbi:MAG: L-asparaginase / beta-aspartyl-peptidase [Verrucomicrobiota bacterium]|jgi:beta-aspartyl-peptidase (threonine type)
MSILRHVDLASGKFQGDETRVTMRSCLAIAFVVATAIQLMAEENNFVLVIHGGAGTIERATMTPEREKEYRAGLERALNAGYEILKGGGAALDATEAVVRVLEDDPHFNAGKGALFTSAGTNELDAAVMDGATLRAGAVCNLKHIKNPVSLARLVMEKSGHVMMSGEGAEAFAKANGVELVDQRYFFTQERFDALQRVKEKQKAAERAGHTYIMNAQDRHGTVGAVALDAHGNLAAATSTGGTTNKRPGRIGDTPVIGAGTYANNATCAVSCTGDGEYFIRANVAHELSALMEHASMSLKDAAENALERAKKIGGEGGLIAVDRHGNFALPFNSAGMYRGHIDASGRAVVEIYR